MCAGVCGCVRLRVCLCVLRINVLSLYFEKCQSQFAIDSKDNIELIGSFWNGSRDKSFTTRATNCILQYKEL